MNTSLSITLVQCDLQWENPDANIKHIASLLPPTLKTDVVVLPEMFSTGFTMRTSLAASTPDVLIWMRHLSADLKAMVAGSLITKDGNRFYNRFWWVSPDGSTYFYDKKHLFSYANENLHFKAGSKHLIIPYKGWKIAPLTCYDLRFPVWARRHADYNYDVLVYTASWPERRSLAWKTLLPARAIENQSFVVGVNRVGVDESELSYSGDSGIWAPNGIPFVNAQAFKEEVHSYTLQKSMLEQYRVRFPFSQDADPFTIG